MDKYSSDVVVERGAALAKLRARRQEILELLKTGAPYAYQDELAAIDREALEIVQMIAAEADKAIRG